MNKYGFAKGYAQVSYERLLLSQPDIRFQGLWFKDGVYYIACEDLDSAIASEGGSISEWFHNYCRVIGYRVDLVSVPPEGATRVGSRTPEQLSQLHGSPLNTSEFYSEIRRQLPSDFPLFRIDDSATSVEIVSAAPLDEDDQSLVEIAIANFGLDIDVNFQVDASKISIPKAPDVYLPDQRLNGWPSMVLKAHEISEQRWVDDRLSLFSSEAIDSDRYIDFAGGRKISCFIDCTFGGRPGNIRSYLTVYNSIYLAPPFGGFSDLLRDLVVSEVELIGLIKAKRVVIVLPAEVHYYDATMLAKILELGGQGLLFGRQLAAATIVETRKRNPLIYPPLDNESRRQILDLMKFDGESREFEVINAFRRYLGSSWSSLEMDFSTQGAKAGFNHGVGGMLTEVFSYIHGGADNPMLRVCATSVEWATALRANYCPVELPGLEPLAKVAASFITGVPNRPVIDSVSNLDLVVKDLLVLDGAAPIDEILDAFSDSDVFRLNEVLKGLYYDPQAVSEYIVSMNKKVKEFERVQRNVKRRDLLGLAAALIPAIVAPGVSAVAAYVPLSVWVLHKILNSESGEGNRVTDWLRAKNSFTSVDAVFISRLRKF